MLPGMSHAVLGQTYGSWVAGKGVSNRVSNVLLSRARNSAGSYWPLLALSAMFSAHRAIYRFHNVLINHHLLQSHARGKI